MWVRFIERFDWSPNAASTVSYRAGQSYNVPLACSKAAMSAGKAVRQVKKNRHSPPVDDYVKIGPPKT